MRKLRYALIGLLITSSCSATDYKPRYSLFKTMLVGMGLMLTSKPIIEESDNCPESLTNNYKEITMTTQNSIFAPTPLAQTKGGTGNSAALINGQVWIGKTGDVPTPSTLTAGTGITITNGTGTITVASSTPSMVWVNNSGTLFEMSKFNGYISTNVGTPTLYLPLTPTIGDIVGVQGTLLQSSPFIVTTPGGASTAIAYNGVTGSSITPTASKTACIVFLCVSGGASPTFSVLSTNGELFTLTP